MRSINLSAHAARISRAGDRPPLTATLARFAADSWLAIAIAVAIGAICFGATGGIESSGGSPLAAGLGANIAVQIALTLGSGLLVAIACALEPAGRVRLFGLGAAIALFALAAFTALSVDWSVEPANSWLEANRTFAYAATFAGAIALVRLAAGRWRSVLAGVLLATVAVSVYALASKVIPESLDAGDTFARLQLPFGYWNAVGLTAALGIGPCLWLGSRREGHGVLSALAAPALCVLLVALMLSYSRGAVLAAVVGVAFWFAVVPLRLRALALLAIGGVAAAAVVAWAFRQPSLSNDNVALAARSSAGHRLGLVLVAALVLAFLAALVLRFAAERHPLSAQRRRTLGIAVLVALALVPVAGVAALAHSSRGLTGSISHAWNELTTPNAQQPSSTASRLTSAGNNHALYWTYAIEVFDTSPAVGAGAGSYPVADQRFMTGPALADYAHSYVFQTLADLGLVGLALSLAVAIGWGFAAIRATGPFRAARAGRKPAERIGLVTMVAVVIAFAVHSAIDWTWFVPGDAVIALLCAGWVAGRGPDDRAASRRDGRRSRASPLAACRRRRGRRDRARADHRLVAVAAAALRAGRDRRFHRARTADADQMPPRARRRAGRDRAQPARHHPADLPRLQLRPGRQSPARPGDLRARGRAAALERRELEGVVGLRQQLELRPQRRRARAVRGDRPEPLGSAAAEAVDRADAGQLTRRRAP